MSQTFDQRTLLRVLFPELDKQLDRLLTSPSRNLFAAPPESVHLMVVGGVAMSILPLGQRFWLGHTLMELGNLVGGDGSAFSAGEQPPTQRPS